MEPNNQFNQNPAPSPVDMGNPAPAMQPHNKKVGPIVAITVVVLALVIAALYLFASSMNNGGSSPTPEPSQNIDQTANSVQQTPDVQVQSITNKADDVQSLQNDLNKSTTGIDSQGL